MFYYTVYIMKSTNLTNSDLTNVHNTKETFLINVVCNNITAKDHMFKEFNYEVIDAMYKTYDENGFPLVYNFLYKYISALPINNNKVIVTLSPDPVISGSTISAMSEKYIYNEIVNNKVNFLSKLKILYITPSSHVLNNYSDITIENLRNSMLSHLLGQQSITYMGNKLNLSKDQFILIGLNDELLNNDEKEELDKLDIKYFTLKQLRKKGITNVIKSINCNFSNDPLMVIYDMSCTSYETAPCVSRFLRDGTRTELKLLNGFNEKELRELFLAIDKNKLVACDITGFDLRIENKERAYRITCEACKIPFYTLIGMKEKKINIFNETSKFIIWRPFEQTSETDIGWFIMKGLSLIDRENIIKSIPSDTIINFVVDIEGVEETVLLAVTTIEEQNEKCFYSSDVKINDCVLYPAQKLSMVFELLNTPENCIIYDC